MRSFLILPLVLPLPLVFPLAALAEDFSVSGAIGGVTVYPDGASITRAIPYSVPAGSHRLIVAEIPEIAAGLQARLTGAGEVTLGALSYRSDLVPPRTTEDSAALAAAKAEVERLETVVRGREDAVETIRLETRAAQARIAFLTGLGQADGIGASGIEALRALSQMVGEEVLSAAQAAQAAEQRVAAAERDMTEDREALEDARQALAALETEREDRTYLTVALEAGAPSEGVLELTYTTAQAGWQPAYGFHLTTGETPALEVERAAYVRQDTGENWDGVTLVLSTSRPSGQSAPGYLTPERLWAQDPEQVARAAPAGSMKMLDAAPAPVMAEMAAAGSYDGLTMQYSYPQPVDIASGADNLRLALDRLDMTPEVYAGAVPRLDATAYLMARVTNTSGEILAPTDRADFYVDGAFVGQNWLDLVPAGDEVELGVGPIDGLRLERLIEGRSEGGRGFVSRANGRDEAVTITLRNLTPRDWTVELTDRVPYSEQDDVKVTWEAQPVPARQDMDGRRGLLGWDIDLPAGESAEVTLQSNVSWPKEKVLR